MLQVKIWGNRTRWIIAGILALLLPVGEILAFPYAPSTLTFTVVEGTSSSPAQTVTFSKKSFVSHNWAATAGSSWLQISPASGTISTEQDTISVQVNPLGFSAGTYSSAFTIAITGRNGGIQTATIPVTFTVSAAPVPPVIGASPTSLSFTATQGGANPAAQAVSISNTGGGTLTWSASDSVPWLTLSPASGTGNGAMTLTVTTGTLATGSYSGTITLAATGAPSVTIPVTFTVSAAPVPPVIGASPTSLSFTATQGGANPAAQAVSISNTGGGTLTWSASDSVPWLTLSPASGTGNGAMTLTVTTGTLATGSYSGTITLAATGAPSVTIPVTFTVAAASTISASPTSLSYAATQGGANPSSQTVTVTNTGGTLTWTASGNATWLSLTPASGSGTGTLTAGVNTAGLAAGTYTGTITVAASGSALQTVGIALTVNPPATSSATVTWDANTDLDLAGYKVYRATASGAYGAPIATLSGNVTSYISASLQVGTTYFFIVTAYDTAGNESLHSNEVSKSIY